MEALARGRRGLREPEPGEPERVSAGGRAGDGGPGRARRAQSPLAARRRGSALRGFEPRPRGRSERCCRWQRFPAASSAPAACRTEGRVVAFCTSAQRSARVSGTSCRTELRAVAFAVFGRGGLWRRCCVGRGAPSRDPWGPSPLGTALQPRSAPFWFHFSCEAASLRGLHPFSKHTCFPRTCQLGERVTEHLLCTQPCFLPVLGHAVNCWCLSPTTFQAGDVPQSLPNKISHFDAVRGCLLSSSLIDPYSSQAL